MAALSSTIALGIGAGASLLQAKQQSDALGASADFSERMAGINERAATMAADDAIKRGEVDARTMEKKGQQVMGSQRVGLAAQGIALDSGSAQDIQTQTAEMNAMDVLTIKNNASLEAWGIKTGAVNARAQADFETTAMRNRQGSTMLTGGLQAVDRLADGYDRRSERRDARARDARRADA